MAATKTTRKAGGISTEAVERATGRDWDHWFRILDRAGALKWPHARIASFLQDEQGCSGWWSQMLTVGYEQARGLRKVHETSRGFQVSKSRTIGAPVGAAFEAWIDARRRSRWLNERGVKIRSFTRNTYLRIPWIDGTTHVDVNVYVKGERRCQVTVQHSKLAGPREVKKRRAYWTAKLEALATLLER